MRIGFGVMRAGFVGFGIPEVWPSPQADQSRDESLVYGKRRYLAFRPCC